MLLKKCDRLLFVTPEGYFNQVAIVGAAELKPHYDLLKP